jgi:cell division protein FtsN
VLPRKGKDFELRLGKLGLTVFVLGMSLALLGVFAFGVKVGKDIDSYPAKIVGIIPGLQGKVLSRPENPDKKTEGAGEKGGNFKLGFYDSLAGKKADSPDDMHQPPQAPPPDPAQPPRPEATAGAAKSVPGGNAETAAPQRAASKPEPKPENAPRKTEERKTEAAKPEKGKYFIQIAALKSEAKARDLKAKLAKLGYSPKLETVNSKTQGKVYRIRMMGFATQQDAAKVMGKLEKQVSGTKCLIHKEPE